VALNSSTIQPAGGNQPHDNFQPTLAITYIISLFGVYPTQT
jgi:microcystin-dependent protein